MAGRAGQAIKIEPLLPIIREQVVGLVRLRAAHRRDRALDALRLVRTVAGDRKPASREPREARAR